MAGWSHTLTVRVADVIQCSVRSLSSVCYQDCNSTDWLTGNIIMQPGVRCTAPASQHKKKGQQRSIATLHQPAISFISKGNLPVPVGSQRPQKCKNFNRLLNSQTTRYKRDRTQDWPVTLFSVYSVVWCPNLCALRGRICNFKGSAGRWLQTFRWIYTTTFKVKESKKMLFIILSIFPVDVASTSLKMHLHFTVCLKSAVCFSRLLHRLRISRCFAIESHLATRCRWEDNIEMDIQEAWWGRGLVWSDLG
jgi:hypothetical protein